MVDAANVFSGAMVHRAMPIAKFTEPGIGTEFVRADDASALHVAGDDRL